MYYIHVYDILNNRDWKEEYSSYYIFRKRIIKLKYSKRLKILSMSNLENV